jgi:hypothetical protein
MLPRCAVHEMHCCFSHCNQPWDQPIPGTVSLGVVPVGRRTTLCKPCAGLPKRRTRLCLIYHYSSSCHLAAGALVFTFDCAGVSPAACPGLPQAQQLCPCQHQLGTSSSRSNQRHRVGTQQPRGFVAALPGQMGSTRDKLCIQSRPSS